MSRATALAILLLALALRLASAAVPMFHHPDEIWQYLEPAWGIVTGRSVVTWEWREGMRSWLLPSFFAAPAAIGRAVLPAGTGPFLLARLCMACLAMAIPVTAMLIGLRRSPLHAIIAGLATATSFELLYFAPRLLSDTIAAALILIAYWLLAERDDDRAAPIATAGLLLGLCFSARFQLAPAIAVLAIGGCRLDRRRWLLAIGGGVAGLAIDALCDAAHGAIPFRWVIRNLELNFFQGMSARFGTEPAGWYLTNQLAVWSWAAILFVPLIVLGARRGGLLLAIEIVNIAFHSLVGHKEYRFVFLSTAILLILAAFGSAELLGWIARRRPRWRRGAIVGLVLAWAGLSAATAASPGGARQWKSYRKVIEQMAAIRAAAPACGVAVYAPGHDGPPASYALLGDVPPIELFDRDAAALDRAGSFDVLLSFSGHAPDGFERRDCIGGRNHDTDACVFVQPRHACARPAAAHDAVNAAMARRGD